MGLRKDATYLQFRNAVPNTALAWNASGVPYHMGVFTPATSLLDGAMGLVPKPLATQQNYILSNNGWIPNTGGSGGSGAYPDLTENTTIGGANTHGFHLENISNFSTLVIDTGSADKGELDIGNTWFEATVDSDFGFMSFDNSTGDSLTEFYGAHGTQFTLGGFSGLINLGKTSDTGYAGALIIDEANSLIQLQRITVSAQVTKIEIGGSEIGTTNVGNILVTGVAGNFQGIRYAADYAAQYTDRSLVDKNFVLTQIALGGAAIINTAGVNEIPKSGSAVTIIPSGIFSTAIGSISLGTGLTGTSRYIAADGSVSDVGLKLYTKGAGIMDFAFGNGGAVIGDTAINGSRVLTVGSNSASADLAIYSKAASSAITLGNTSSTASSFRFDGSTATLSLQKSPTAGATTFDIVGSNGINATFTHGDSLRIKAGDGYDPSGNGQGGSVIVQAGIKRAGGSGVDGAITLAFRDGILNIGDPNVAGNRLVQIGSADANPSLTIRQQGTGTLNLGLVTGLINLVGSGIRMNSAAGASGQFLRYDMTWATPTGVGWPLTGSATLTGDVIINGTGGRSLNLGGWGGADSIADFNLYASSSINIYETESSILNSGIDITSALAANSLFYSSIAIGPASTIITKSTDSTENNIVGTVLTLRKRNNQTSGVGAAGMGTQLEFVMETTTNNVFGLGAGLAYVWDTPTVNAMVGHYDFTLHVASATATKILELNRYGLIYSADYSANYTTRSLVDKAYVDSVAGSGITNTSAANELPKTSSGNLVSSDIFANSPGNITLGSTGLGGDRAIMAEGFSSSVSISYMVKGNQPHRFTYDSLSGAEIWINPFGDTISRYRYAGTPDGALIIQGSSGINSTYVHGDGIQLLCGSAYATSGNGSGGSIQLQPGTKRAAGSGVDGYIHLAFTGTGVLHVGNFNTAGDRIIQIGSTDTNPSLTIKQKGAGRLNLGLISGITDLLGTSVVLTTTTLDFGVTSLAGDRSLFVKSNSTNASLYIYPQAAGHIVLGIDTGAVYIGSTTVIGDRVVNTGSLSTNANLTFFAKGTGKVILPDSTITTAQIQNLAVDDDKITVSLKNRINGNVIIQSVGSNLSAFGSAASSKSWSWFPTYINTVGSAGRKMKVSIQVSVIGAGAGSVSFSIQRATDGSGTGSTTIKDITYLLTTAMQNCIIETIDVGHTTSDIRYYRLTATTSGSNAQFSTDSDVICHAVMYEAS